MLNQANSKEICAGPGAGLQQSLQIPFNSGCSLTIYEGVSSSLPPLSSYLSFKDIQDSPNSIIFLFFFELKTETSVFQQLWTELAPQTVQTQLLSDCACRPHTHWCVQVQSVISAAVHPPGCTWCMESWQGLAVVWTVNGVCAGGIWGQSENAFVFKKKLWVRGSLSYMDFKRQ